MSHTLASAPLQVPRGIDRRSFEQIRGDFPILFQRIQGHPLVYLDSAASSQMPQPVLDALIAYHTTLHSNVHRGVHTLSQRATQAYEDARAKVADFIHAPEPACCIFVRGATEGINLVMHGWAAGRLGPGDEVLVSAMEHHSNIVPWQMLCQRTQARLKVIPLSEEGDHLDLAAYEELLTPRVKLVALGHVSNALGTVHPVEKMAQMAHQVGALMLVDGCQAVPHMPVDVQALGVDFYTFSAHKMYGPTGIGVLWGRRELLDEMEPFQGGGSMIESVAWEGTTYGQVPEKFEAGTPAIAAAVGMGAAVEYLLGIGLERIQVHEQQLLGAATEAMLEIPGLRIFGQAAHKAALISFDFEHIHPHDIGTLLDSCGVAVRTGQHCTEPLMRRLELRATARASFGLYNTLDDVDRLIQGLHFVREMFS